jgi:LAS superfamily LD-carboxypeptidase LdcB
MKRSIFLKTCILSGLGLAMLPHYSFVPEQEKFTRNQLVGKGNPDIVGDSYTSRMHKEALLWFKRMQAAAAISGIRIESVSSYRSFERQKQIYEGKYKRYTGQGLSPEEAIEKIIEYSTIPGTSRHHWGTEIDIIDANAPRPRNLLVPDHYHGNGPFCKLKDWMDENAESFGFYEVFTDNPHRKGFEYEPWHFSYAPVSIPMMKEYQKIDLKQMLRETDIMGSEYFTDDFIDRYISENILDINPDLL